MFNKYSVQLTDRFQSHFDEYIAQLRTTPYVSDIDVSFTKLVYQAIDNISEFPELHPAIMTIDEIEMRSFIIKRFRRTIFYSVNDDVIIVWDILSSYQDFNLSFPSEEG